jgi:hypothetical protein
MTFVPQGLLREIAETASSYQDALERLRCVEAHLGGMAAWTPPPERHLDADDGDEPDEYAPPPAHWSPRKDRDWITELRRANDQFDACIAAFGGTEVHEPWPYPPKPLADGEAPFDAREYAELQSRGVPRPPLGKVQRSGFWRRAAEAETDG